jgi:hypothetical protein
MEETDVCYPTPAFWAIQQAIPNNCPAKNLLASQRQQIGLHALAKSQTVTSLADDFDVSRKFVYQQAAIAQTALDEAFTPSTTDDDARVLFHLPVTKAWLRQVTLALVLVCHSSYRGVVEFFRDILDVSTSVGTVHNVLSAAVEAARAANHSHDLANINIAGLDEIFQTGQPVLVGVDMASSYCFLLSQEEHRDADTWGVRLLEAADRGFHPAATIADFAAGIRAGQQLALPGLPCRGDVFHALDQLLPVATFLENRAYDTMTAHDKIEHKKAHTRKRGRSVQPLARKATLTERAQAKAIRLADDIALLVQWLQRDAFAVSGLPYADRCHLFDFILAELQTRIPLCPHRLAPVCTLLKNHRDELLAFARQLDDDLAKLATDFQAPLPAVRDLLDLQAIDPSRSTYWRRAADLRQRLRHHYYALQQAVQRLADQVVRASSLVENLNSRLRNYLFLRRQLGPDYLTLLQFFLNHRRFLASEHPQRANRSPAECLTGQPHAHWLELLGYTRFSRN